MVSRLGRTALLVSTVCLSVGTVALAPASNAATLLTAAVDEGDISAAQRADRSGAASQPYASGRPYDRSAHTQAAFAVGDVNGDSAVNAADVFYLLAYLFGGGPAPVGSADTNGDGVVTAADLFYLMHFLFAGGPAPVGPAVLPPDPVEVAPPVDATVPTNVFDSTTFIYTGSNPIQTGVSTGTIERKRASVLRGRVINRSEAPVSGVKITIRNHAEFGQTLTRLDGMFDMAVNGGDLVTLNYEKSGYLPVQRQLSPRTQDYAHLDDVVMIPLDVQITTVDLSAATSVQVAQGSAMSDADGTRRTTMLFSQGTTAATGSGTPLSNLHIRATEYTVGANGPKTMPGVLPPTSGYTYAMEMSADEVPGQDVRFSKPVITYVENFLNFPVGGIVPVGYYDRAKAAWIPSDNGRVIKIVSIVDGMANVDIDGDGAAQDAASLAAFGMTDPERKNLASLYTVGQTLWRVAITHFTPWDCNWPYGPPNDAKQPDPPQPQPDRKVDNPTIRCGSVIECQNQVLGEAVGITGTPLTLNYKSDRVPGRKTAYTIDIPITGASVPASVVRIDLEISLAGRQFTQTFQTLPNQTHRFTWDGKDAYGRTLQGAVPATVRVGWVYHAVYQQPAQFSQSFAAISGIPMTASRATNEIVLWQESHPILGSLDFRSEGLGGWTLSAHHNYSPFDGVLYQGDGTQRAAKAESAVISTVAGNGTLNSPLSGVQATQSPIGRPEGICATADGGFYFTSAVAVLRVGPDGVMTKVAGGGTALGDGGPAVAANLSPADVAMGPDGSLYIADLANHRIRRVAPNGIISTVAGNGTTVFSGDGGPATEAGLYFPHGVAIAPDGTLYISDYGHKRIRRVGTNGIITTVAGNGIDGVGPGAEGALATDVTLDEPWKIAIASDGSLYLGDHNRIRRIGTNGLITTIAGDTLHYTAGYTGDGGPAKDALLRFAMGVAFAKDGSLYFSDSGNQRIRRIGPDGIITTIAGDGTNGINDGGTALLAGLSTPQGLAAGADGSIYIADYEHYRVRRLSSKMPGLSLGETAIASEDGSLLHIFSGAGRHLRTLNARTGSIVIEFGYDAVGRLASLTDGDGNVTTIERDLAGKPTAIVAPFGQRTTLSLDTDGYLATITNPANETHHMTYAAEGLLTQFSDPRGNSSVMTYDALGRLLKEQNAANGSTSLNRAEAGANFAVTTTTALNRNTVGQIENLSTGDQRRVTIDPAGTRDETVIKPDGTTTETSADGVVSTSVEGPNPRFGMQAPISKSVTTVLPSGLTLQTATEQKVTLSKPEDLFSLVDETRKVTVNGKTFTSFYDAVLKQYTMTSPLNRQRILKVDGHGRAVREEISGVEPLTYAYDSRGRLASVTQGSGSTVRTLGFAYDLQGNVSALTDPLGRIQTFTYDSVGRLTAHVRTDGSVAGYTYDANGNVTAVTPPGRPSHLFSYTALDEEAQYTPPAAGVTAPETQYSYDLDDQLTHMKRPGGQIADIAYDASGRLSTLTIASGTTAYIYGATTGQLIQITAPGAVLGYSYDGSMPLMESWSGAITGTVTRTYNNDFQIIGLSVNGETAVPYAYDADGLLVQAGDMLLTRNAATGFLTGTTLGLTTTSQTYSFFGELSRFTAVQNGTAFFDLQFVRDNAGRVVQKNETAAGQTSSFSYSYDMGGRLSAVGKNGVSATYAYDGNGNCVNYDGTSATYDDQDRLLTYGTVTYSYTDNGELKTRSASGQATQYTYDVLGNLTGVVLPSGKAVTYVIDGMQRRIGRKVDGTLVQVFLYQGGLSPIAELDGANNVVSRFVYGVHVNVPDYLVKGGVTYRIITDFLGSPRMVVNTATGLVVQAINYDVLGKVISDTNPGFQPFGFAGGLYDQDTGLVRFGTRDYDAQTGRWTAKDPILFGGRNTNLYAYASGDPVNYIDSTGLEESAAKDVGEKVVERVATKVGKKVLDNAGIKEWKNPKSNKEYEEVNKIAKDATPGVQNFGEKVGGTIGKSLAGQDPQACDAGTAAVPAPRRASGLTQFKEPPAAEKKVGFFCDWFGIWCDAGPTAPPAPKAKTWEDSLVY